MAALRTRCVAVLAVLLLGLTLHATAASARTSRAHVTASVTLSALPAEARETVALIRRGGPFRYERDGAVFGNFEGALPAQNRGYYREYTVHTPGLAHRGARRIVSGRAGELYYTDDHYRTFRRINE